MRKTNKETLRFKNRANRFYQIVERTAVSLRRLHLPFSQTDMAIEPQPQRDEERKLARNKDIFIGCGQEIYSKKKEREKNLAGADLSNHI